MTTKQKIKEGLDCASQRLMQKLDITKFDTINAEADIIREDVTIYDEEKGKYHIVMNIKKVRDI